MNKKIKGFTLIELMIVVAIMGILAAVAIPAFIRYIQRAKTSEGVSNVQKIYSGAVAYYNSEHVTRNFGATAILSHRFPCDSGFPGLFAGAMWCPAPGLLPTGGEKIPQPQACWANNAPLEGPTWKALDFSIADHSYFSYQFLCTINDDPALGPMPAFRGQAQGLLDNNDQVYYFERSGYAEPVNQTVIGSAGVHGDKVERIWSQL